MKLYRTNAGCIVEHDNRFYSAGDASWDALVAQEDLEDYLRNSMGAFPVLARNPLEDSAALRAPIGSQEVWAAGVTYYAARAPTNHILRFMALHSIPLRTHASAPRLALRNQSPSMTFPWCSEGNPFYSGASISTPQIPSNTC
jgi:hypothetical protein